MPDHGSTPTIRLSPNQERILRDTAANDGVIHVGEWMAPADRKAADALVRYGLLSPGSGLHGSSARHITHHGQQVLAELTGKEASRD